MKYLHLKFKNAGLLSFRKGGNGAASPHYMYNQEKFGDTDTDRYSKGHDLENPIPYTLLSNVLHCLCGEIPVPTKRISIFTRSEELDKIAQNSHFKFETDLYFDKRGNPLFKETYQTQKNNANTVAKNTLMFKLHDGAWKTIIGHYCWAYFDKQFKKDSDIHKNYLTIIQKYIGVNPRTLNMRQVVFELSKHWDKEEFINDVVKFLKENKKSRKAWNELFFNFNIDIKGDEVVIDRKPTEGNGNYRGATPILNIRGINYVTRLNGDIICPIEDENIINRIKEGKGFANFLEGGLIYVDTIDFFEPIPNYKDSFKPIFSNENQYNPLNNKEL